MEEVNKASLSEDEEDLEALRLAALQSLKKSASSSQRVTKSQENSAVSRSDRDYYGRSEKRPYSNYANKRNQYYGGRGAKNGHINKFVNSNLISLTQVAPREELSKSRVSERSRDHFQPKSSLNKGTEENTKSDEASSKFDRYKDTDKSEEDDSEDEMLKSDSDVDDSMGGKLERSDSLEALMQELNDEIQGTIKIKEKIKLVKAKAGMKRKKENSKTEIEEECASEYKTNSEKDNTEEKINEETVGVRAEEATGATNSTEHDDSAKEKSLVRQTPVKKRRYSPPASRGFRGFRGRGQQRGYRYSPPVQHIAPFGPIPFQSNPMFNNPTFGPPSMINPPPFYERPLSPLLINTENLQTQTMAPLSPRSAAFVLQNRAIIEKRKRSPPRSFSRSPSPGSRSLSPTPPPRRQRSLSPRKRSKSPRKGSLSPLRKRSRSPIPLKRRSTSPRRRSASPKRRAFSPKLRLFSPKPRGLRPLSPRRRSMSPRRRSLSPRRREKKDPAENISKAKPSIRDRLGLKSSTKPEEKDSNIQSESSPKKDDKPIDPVLEARKKKFESNKEIKVKEGVIRLKPKDEPKQEEMEVEPGIEIKEVENPKTEEPTEETKLKEREAAKEDALLAESELDLDTELDLFLDEFLGDEVDEGLTKTKDKPFAKAVIEPSREVKEKPKEKKEVKRSRSPRVKSKSTTERKSIEISPSSASRSKFRVPKIEKSPTKKKLGVKSERHPKKFERKIEIKIKNPAKYEQNDLLDDGDKEQNRAVRKIEMGSENDEDDDDTEIVVETDEDEVENNANNEGDLRAQLSKKRAEKLQKTTKHKGVSSRLLQNALQNALPLKKKPRKSKSKELSSNDGRVPIHLRLGLACDQDIFSKPKRKSKKRKNIERDDDEDQ